MSKGYLIFTFCAVLLALVLGYFLRPYIGGPNISQETRQAMEKYPQIDSDICLSVPSSLRSADSSVRSCFDGLLTAHALSQKDATVCQDINDGLLKADCFSRVMRLQDLSEETELFCQGVSTDELCYDLALTLLARETGQTEHCLEIQNNSQRQTCVELFAGSNGEALSLANAPEQEISESGLPAEQFGLICAAEDSVCQDARPDFIRAVSSLNESLCRELGLYSQPCLDELALFRSFQTDDQGYCEQRFPTEVCTISLTIARALEAEDASICDSLNAAAAIQSCQNAVQNAAETRFEYLGL